MSNIIVAVDGPVAAGKGTLGRRLAAYFDFAYLDTGGLYRAVALRMLRAGEDLHDVAAMVAQARAVNQADLEDPALRAEETGEAASVVAPQAELRAALLQYQRKFAANPPNGAAGAVLDGRDIGTVVCPDAQAKLFVTASALARAERRHALYRRIFEAGADLHGALENMAIRNPVDAARLEDIFMVEQYAATSPQVQ